MKDLGAGNATCGGDHDKLAWSAQYIAPPVSSMRDSFKLHATADSHFPAHGYIVSASGVPHLRFPIARLFQFEQPHYDRFERNGLAGIWLQSRSPVRLIRRIVVALRDLSKVLRTLHPIISNEDLRREHATELAEGHERIEILLIAIFALLRRLGDDLIDAARPLLFDNWASAPRELKRAQAWARSGEFDRAGPICHLPTLVDALLSETAWFDQLRQDEGVRDVLIHKPHILQVSEHGLPAVDGSEISWTVRATLLRIPRDVARLANGHREPVALVAQDLLPLLRECLAGACSFMGALYRSIGTMDGYTQRDALVVTGRWDDIVALWPAADRA